MYFTAAQSVLYWKEKLYVTLWSHQIVAIFRLFGLRMRYKQYMYIRVIVYKNTIHSINYSATTIPLMPTLAEYPGVSQIQNKSPGLLYGSPNLPDKSEFGYFLFFLQKTKYQVNFISKLKKYCVFLSRMVVLFWNFTQFWFGLNFWDFQFVGWGKLGQTPKSS